MSKCKIMRVARQKDSCSYYMEGIKLMEEETEKVLRSLDLIRRELLPAMCMCAFNRSSNIMRMIKRKIEYREVMIMMNIHTRHCSAVRPQAEYCASAWSPYRKTDRELFEKVQRRFTKMTTNREGLSWEDV